MSGEHGGMSTLTKVLLIVGGVGGTLVLAVVVIGVFALRTVMEDAPGFLEEFGEQLENAAVASLGNVSTSFTEVVSEAGTFMLIRDGMLLEPAAEGSGFTFNLEAADGETVGLDLAGVREYLDQVGRGELYFADIARGGTADDTGGTAESAVPDWVAVYPEARHSASVFAELEEFYFGIEVLLADAPAEEVLEWYQESREDPAGLSLRASSSVSTGPGARGHGSVMLAEGDHRMTVLVAEDERQNSFFVILYKG